MRSEYFSASLVRAHALETSDAQVDAVIEHIKLDLAADPYALLHPIEPGEAGAQLLYVKGYNLESAMYLASLTGSSIYTDVEAHWQQLHMHALLVNRAPNTAWAPVVESMRAVSLPIDMNAHTLLEALQAGRFGSIRPVLRRFAEAVQESSAPRRAEEISQQLNEAALGVQREWADVASTFRLNGRVELSVPLSGFERNEVRRLLLTFGRVRSVRPVPFAMLIKLEASAVRRG
jgi:hypothetical protein